MARRVRRPNKKFRADGKSRARSRSARNNLRLGNRRFRTIQAKMAFLRSLRRG